LIARRDATQWILWLAALPLWKPETWRAVGTLTLAATALAARGGTPRDKCCAPRRCGRAGWMTRPPRLLSAALPATSPPAGPTSPTPARRRGYACGDLLGRARRASSRALRALGKSPLHRGSAQHAGARRPFGESPQYFLANYGPFAQAAELGCGEGILVKLLLTAR
jgi:hypothetical protein